MPDLETALAEVRRFAEHPPSRPPSVERLATRASRRRRRRRVSVAASGAIALSLLVVTVAVAALDDRRAEVRTVDAPVRASEPPASGMGLVVEPDTGLEEGKVVSVSGPFEPDDIVGVGQCASEALEVPDPMPWCDINVPRSEPNGGELDIEVTVVRALRTANGFVDCAVGPERCLIGVRAGRDLLAPISFRDDLGPLQGGTLEVDRRSVADGEAVTVTGDGLLPHALLTVSQCIGTPGDPRLMNVDVAEGCDQARWAPVATDAHGRFQARHLAYADVRTGTGWARCQPCVLRVAGLPSLAPAITSIEVEVDVTPTHPTVTIEPGGPYDPGERVTLIGSGFQANQGDIEIGWCGFTTDRPETEIQGDPTNGYTPCAYPAEAYAIGADDLGRFTVERFPLPTGPFYAGGAADCRKPGTRCGLAWHPGEGSLPVFVTLFELGP